MVPNGVEHPDADAFVEFAAACGYGLMPWQEFVLRKSLLRTGRGRSAKWAGFLMGLCVARQNGKTLLSEIRELGGPLLLGESLILHSAHLGDTVRESFLRMQETLEANEWLSREVRHVRRQNGHESIEFRNGGRIRFRTRTSSGGRGYAGADLVLFDEAMFLSEEARASLTPTLSTSDDPQIWYLGSAVDRMVHGDGLVFSQLRSRALAGEPRMFWFEWSVDVDGPDAVTAEMAADPEQIALASPSLGHTITLGYVQDERRGLLSERSYAVERLSAGDWFTGEEAESGPIPIDTWLALTDESSRLQDPVCLAFDVSPDRRASIAVAGLNQHGTPHVEITDNRAGTRWLPERVAEIVGRNDVQSVKVAGSSPALSIVRDVEELGVKVDVVPVDEHAEACGRLVDAVEDGALTHLGSSEVANAIRGAATRPFGDAWLWSRRTSGADISPLVAVTLALDAAANMDDGEVRIW